VSESLIHRDRDPPTTVNYTEFASVVFIDADQLVLRNIDHLAAEPGFTSSYTLTCCNPGFPA